MAIERLIVLLPAGAEPATCHRIPYLDPDRVACDVYVYSTEDYAVRLDPRDYEWYGNREGRRGCELAREVGDVSAARVGNPVLTRLSWFLPHYVGNLMRRNRS